MTARERLADLVRRPKPRRRIVLTLWLAALAVAAVRIGVMASAPGFPGDPWQTSEGYFEDFRDIVWVPGRHLLEGRNPYDLEAYLAAHPWAQQFSPYPPAWLLLGVVLAPLPYLISGVLFQMISLAAAAVMLRVICGWALPRFVDLAVPTSLLYINIWYPGRGAMSSLGTVLAVLGVALVLRSVTRVDAARTDAPGVDPSTRRGRAAVDLACSVGIGLIMIKPHIGFLVVVVAAVSGRLREVWRGTLGLIVASVPVFLACSVAAGGPLAFLASVWRNVVYVATGPGGAALGSVYQRRLDLLGVLDQHGVSDFPLWMLIGTPLLAVAVAILVVRITRNPFWVTTVACTAVIIGFFHPRYDVLLMITPLAIGIGAASRGELTGLAARLTLVACALVVLRMNSVYSFLIPGLTVLGGTTIDLVFVIAALIFALCGCLAEVRRRDPAAARA